MEVLEDLSCHGSVVDGGEDITEVVEVLGFEVVFVAGGIQVWWVEEEDGVFAVVSEDKVRNLYTL